MIKRIPAEATTYDTRGESHESVDKSKRYSQIISCLVKQDMTAKEVAVMMFKLGLIPSTERNFTAPRLTELSQMGVVEPVGRTKCKWTGKTVAVYALTETWRKRKCQL